MHVMASLSRSGAGVYEAVLGATRAFIRTGGGRVTVAGGIDAADHWPQDRQAWEEAGAEVVVVPRSRLACAVTASRVSRRWPLQSWALNRCVLDDTRFRSVDVVHGHGLWCGASVAAAALAQRIDRPLVISPHGMLEPWARRHHRYRKQLAWGAGERAAVGSAGLLQAMSEPEAASFRVAGLFQPVVVHPVGIGHDAAVHEPSDHGTSMAAGGQRECLFLSRLHAVKGLAMLLQAWGQVQPAGWRLTIGGPDQCGHRAAMERLAHRLGIAGSVAFVGAVHGPAKWQRLADADLFVLPSYSENFGVVIAEALAAATPVITTTSTPWGMLPASGAGWWVPPDVASLADALREASGLPVESLRAMGCRGGELARERCDWSVIAATIQDAYRWLVHGGATPAAVRFVEAAAR